MMLRKYASVYFVDFSQVVYISTVPSFTGNVVAFAHQDDGSLNHSPINTILKYAGVKTVEF